MGWNVLKHGGGFLIHHAAFEFQEKFHKYTQKTKSKWKS